MAHVVLRACCAFAQIVDNLVEEKAARAIKPHLRSSGPRGQLLRQQAVLLEPDLDEPPGHAEVHRQKRDHLLEPEPQLEA